ncbi:MAG: DUF3644 domain-containing protein [Pseudomonadota bacterium]
MAEQRIGKTIKPYVQKARDAALLAVEIYNKPAVAFKSSAYIALMVMAWTALLHAIVLRGGGKPYYKTANGRFEKIDDDFRHWELGECVRQYWKQTPHDPVRLNLEFFIPLRNKIEHRYLPALDNAIFGECQALLLNFDDAMGQHFGKANQVRESLSFSLQLFPNGESFAQAVKANKNLADIKKFVDNYRAMLTADVAGSSQFAFKAFLIQVANHASKDALPIQFVHRDKLTVEQQTEFDKFAVMIKWKDAGGGNKGYCKPSSVVAQVQAALGNPKVERAGKQVDRFNQTGHQRCWKHYKARPSFGTTNPEATDLKWCVYDSVHHDYVYTHAWVTFLIARLADEQEFSAVVG